MSDVSSFVKRVRDIMWLDAGLSGDAQRIEQLSWMLFLKVYDAKEEDWEMDEDIYVSIIPEEYRWRNWAHDDEKGKALTGDGLLDFINNKLLPTLKTLPVDSNTEIKKSIVQTTFEDVNNYMKDGVRMRQVFNIIDELDLGDSEESHKFGEIYESILKSLQSEAGEFYTPRAVTDLMAKIINPQIGERVADFACGTGGFLTSWLKELEPKIKTVADQELYANSIYGIEKKYFPYILCITNMLLHGIEKPQIFHDNALEKDVLDYTEKDQFDVILMNPPYGGKESASIKTHFPTDLRGSDTYSLFMDVIMYRLKKNGRAAVVLPDGFLFNTDEKALVRIKEKLFSEFNLHTVIRMPGSVFAPYVGIATNLLFFDNTKSTETVWFYRYDLPGGVKFSKTKNPITVEKLQPILDWWDNREEINIDGNYKAKEYTLEDIKSKNYDIDLCGYPHDEEEILPPKELIQQYHKRRASLNANIDRVLAQITDILGIDLTDGED